MRIAILSDIHGNVVALEAVLAHIRHETTPDLTVIAGDLAVDGPRPAESVALLRAIPNGRFAIGNTDQDLLHERDEASNFARTRLDGETLEWIDSIPFSQVIEAAPGHELLVVHANPKNLRDALKPDHSPALIRPFIEGVPQRLIAFGHYHIPYLRTIDDYTLVDVASVGLPRDGVLRAVYVTITYTQQQWHISHHRVAFDHERVAQDYEAVGYPDAKKKVRKFLEARY